MKIRVFFGQPVEENGKKEEPVALEVVSGDDIDSTWFKKEVARWKTGSDYSGFAVVDIEVDENRIREICGVPVVKGKIVDRKEESEKALDKALDECSDSYGQ